MLTDQLVTREVAEYLDISVSTVIRLAKRGELPYLRKQPGKRGGYLFALTIVEMYRRQTGAPAVNGSPRPQEPRRPRNQHRSPP